MAETRFDHIAIATHRLADAPAFLVGELGGIPEFGMPSGPYTFGQWRYAGGGLIEVLEPLGADGFLHRFLATRGPGIHHVTFKVPSLRAACARARQRGYDIVGLDESYPDWHEAFLHPRQAMGIVVQLAQTSGHGAPPSWTPPPGPAHPPAPVEVLGLRLRARDADRALAQWEGIVDGAVTKGPEGERVFAWPGSPMRLFVEVDPAGDEGPVAIEVASSRALALPAGPHPVLGAAFAQRAAP
jgi:methylmalonyl-CoA/ethylmalonyl-CoA epimerase